MTRNRTSSGCDVAVWFVELDELDTDGLRLVCDLNPQRIRQAQQDGAVRHDIGMADLVTLLAGVPGSDVPASVHDR